MKDKVKGKLGRIELLEGMITALTARVDWLEDQVAKLSPADEVTGHEEQVPSEHDVHPAEGPNT